MNKIQINTADVVGTVAPEIFGHFAEHIGGVIYDGIWVGTDSKIPNVEGFRLDAIEKLRAIHPPVIRWPGGCFVETYNWRDGVGKNRPTRLSWWTKDDGRYETNEFGTHEFLRFCELVGAKPYIAVNVTTMTPMDARDYVDYCTSPKGTTTLAKLREENGHAEPFEIPYWGIGNENWGGGGTMTPAQYALTYRLYASAMRNITGKSVLVAGACNVHGYDWAETFADHLAVEYGTPVAVDAVSLHHYCGGGDSITFTEEDWEYCLSRAKQMEELIDRHRAIFRAKGKGDLALYVDEWGCMNGGESALSKEKYLFEQQSAMRDAVIAAYNLNLFIRRCDFVKMANIAQLINCLHSLFLANEERFTVTPTYHVYDMFLPHMDAECLHTAVDDERLSAVATRKDGMITVTVANLSYGEARKFSLKALAADADLTKAEVTLLGDGDPHAHNSFEKPDAVLPQKEIKDIRDGFTLPSASVASLRIPLK